MKYSDKFQYFILSLCLNPIIRMKRFFIYAYGCRMFPYPYAPVCQQWRGARCPFYKVIIE